MKERRQSDKRHAFISFGLLALKRHMAVRTKVTPTQRSAPVRYTVQFVRWGGSETTLTAISKQCYVAFKESDFVLLISLPLLPPWHINILNYLLKCLFFLTVKS